MFRSDPLRVLAVCLAVGFVGCSDDAEVVFYTIEEGGHTWPSGWPIPAMGKTTRALDATEELWSFFRGYQVDGLP